MTEFPWEDNLLERKVESDLKDLIKTLVAFANSVKPNHIAKILIGEKDDGTVQGVANPDNIQKKVRKECERIYPPIIWRSSIYEKDEKYCVRVEIEYDGDTPHFGGISWIRRGSETIIATDDVFQSLIDLRSSKVRELAKWLDKEVTVSRSLPTNLSLTAVQLGVTTQKSRWGENEPAKIVFLNNHWVTFQKISVPAKYLNP